MAIRQGPITLFLFPAAEFTVYIAETRFEMADDNVRLHGVIIEADNETGMASSVKRVAERLD